MVRIVLNSCGVFFATVLVWKRGFLMSSSARTAQGAGFYRPYGVMFMVTGGLFFVLGLFLRFR